MSGEMMRSPISAFGVALWCLPGLVLAQAIPAGYVESARLQAVASNQTFLPKVINNKGEVGGWTTKPNGSILRWGSNVTPLGFSIPYLYSAPQVDISPVVWTAGVPKVLARYKSTNSTWLLDKKDDSTWVVATSNKSGRIDASTYPDTGVDASFGRTPISGTVRLLKNGVYTDFPAGVQNYARPLMNRQGSVVTSATGGTGLALVRSNGQRSEVAMPDGLAYWEIKGLSDYDEVLIEGAQPDFRWKKRCFVWKGGALTEIQVSGAQAVISVACGGISSTGIVAGFAYQQIGTEVNPYALLGSVFTWRDQVLNQSEFVADGGGANFNTFVTPDGLVGFNRNSTLTAGYLYAQGRVQALASLVSPALASGEAAEVLSVNDSGQLLVAVRSLGSAAIKARFSVLSPK
jgi:hypothetical protein